MKNTMTLILASFLTAVALQLTFCTAAQIGASGNVNYVSETSDTNQAVTYSVVPALNSKQSQPQPIPIDTTSAPTTSPTTTKPNDTTPATTTTTTTTTATTATTTISTTTTITPITTQPTNATTTSTITPPTTSLSTIPTSTNGTIPTTRGTTSKPTAAPTAAPSSDRRFDGPSFIGGIVLSVGIMAIGFVAWKFYKARTERNYHTL